LKKDKEDNDKDDDKEDDDKEQPPPRSPRTSTTKRYGNKNTAVPRTDKHFERHPTPDSSECEEEEDPFGTSSDDDDSDEAEMNLQPEEAADNNEGREGFLDSNGAPLSPIRKAGEDPFGKSSDNDDDEDIIYDPVYPWCRKHPEGGDVFYFNTETRDATFERPSTEHITLIPTNKDILSCK